MATKLREGWESRRRFGDEPGEPGLGYKEFRHVLEDGARLRAVQLAQRLLDLNLSSVEALQAGWAQVATKENGFREGDTELPQEEIIPEDEEGGLHAYSSNFRSKVVNAFRELLEEKTKGTIRPDEGKGLPRSSLEASAINRMVDGIREELRRRQLAVEAGEPLRYAGESFMRAFVGRMAEFEGLTACFGPRGKNLVKVLEDNVSAKLPTRTLRALARTLYTGFMYGTAAVFRQIKHETEDPKEEEMDTLDLPLFGRLLKAVSGKFIGGDTFEETMENPDILEALAEGAGFTAAYEVECTYELDQAERNFQEVQKCLGNVAARENPRQKNMSVKLTGFALYDQDPSAWSSEKPPKPRKEEVKAKMRILLEEAVQTGVYINIDMEYVIHKDVTFEIFTELLEENHAYADHLGMVFQAYLKDSPQDAEEMVFWAEAFFKRTGKRVNLRLVKGANKKIDEGHSQKGYHHYFAEGAWHKKPRRSFEEGPDQWIPDQNTPLAKDNETTQAQFLKIAKLFEENSECLNVRYGTMNPETAAHIFQIWLNKGENYSERQIKMLLGMYTSFQKVLRQLVKMDVYAPYTVLGKIIEYMLRRFLEYQSTQKKGRPRSRWEVTARGVEVKTDFVKVA